MSSSSFGSAAEMRPKDVPMCKCGVKALLRMSWSRDDAGRRFFGCSNYGTYGFCGFHKWHDGPTPERLRVIIYGLVKKLDALQRHSAVANGREIERRGYVGEAGEAEKQNNDEAMEARVGHLRKQNKKLKFLFVASWVFFIWRWYGY